MKIIFLSKEYFNISSIFFDIDTCIINNYILFSIVTLLYIYIDSLKYVVHNNVLCICKDCSYGVFIYSH